MQRNQRKKSEVKEFEEGDQCLHLFGLLCAQFQALYERVSAGSPSRGGDVKVCVLDINQLSLPAPFTLFFCLFLSYGPFICISFLKFSRQLSIFSLCSPSLISALLVLSTIYLFLKISLKKKHDLWYDDL